MKVVTFRLAWGAWAPELHMATALDKSMHFLAACVFGRNDQSLREVEQLRQSEVETNYDSGKQV